MINSISETRRYLHANPELSYEEKKTSDYICGFLDQIGVAYKRHLTSVVAQIDTGREGINLAFRADMDALGLNELNELPYKSNSEGVMHACGHDAHTSILLYTVKEISEHLDDYKGRFTFLFQHAEEVPPGGASALIEAGFIDGIDRIYGLHCDPEYEVGQVMAKPGPLMAAADKFKVTIIGKGGHGAMPHRTIDPIVLASQVIVNLQTVVSRNTDPLASALITIANIHGGNSFNVIPEAVTFEGTVRSLSKEVHDETQRRIRTILDGMTQAYEAKYELDWLQGYPVLMNKEEDVLCIKEATEKLFGDNSFIMKEEARLLGEDFSSYLEKVPGAFFFLGTKGDASTGYPLHSPRFNIDERALDNGVRLFSEIAKKHNGI